MPENKTILTVSVALLLIGAAVLLGGCVAMSRKEYDRRMNEAIDAGRASAPLSRAVAGSFRTLEVKPGDIIPNQIQKACPSFKQRESQHRARIKELKGNYESRKRTLEAISKGQYYNLNDCKRDLESTKDLLSGDHWDLATCLTELEVCRTERGKQ